MRPVETDLWKARDVARLLSLVEADRRYFQELLASLPVPVALLDADLTMTSCNYAFRHLAEPAPGDSRAGAAEWLERTGFREKARKTLESGEPAEHEFEEGERSIALSLHAIRHWDEDILCVTVRPATRRETAAPAAMAASAAAGNPAATPRVSATEPVAPPAPAPEWGAATWIADAGTLRILTIARGTLPVSAETWAPGCSLLRRNITPVSLPAVSDFLEGAAAGQPLVSCDYSAIATDGSPLALRDIVRQKGTELHGITIDNGAARSAERQRAQAVRIDALTRMASRMVHDSNNLIMIMGGYGEDLLQALPPESSLRVNVREILAAGERLATATRQLTLFTKRAPVDIRPVALDAFLDGIRRFGQGLPREIALTAIARNRDVVANADPVQLQSVVETLIQRAASGLPNGGTIAVEVSLRQPAHIDSTQPPHPRQACIEIRDSGLAIHPEVLARLFEPDASADPLRQRLPSVYQAVRDMSGDIEAYADFPSGTGFRILLGIAPSTSAARTPDAPPAEKIRVKEVPEHEPAGERRTVLSQPIQVRTPPVAPIGPSVITPELLKQPDSVAPAPTREPARAPEPPKAAAIDPPSASERPAVLVVDDEAGIRSLLRKVLLREGYNVLEATQGREGLETAKSYKGKIDLLLTDVVMPEMNGIELAQSLHALRPSTRILLISGYMGSNALETEKLPAGTAFLQKPFTLNSLLAKVKEVLGTTSRPATS